MRVIRLIALCANVVFFLVYRIDYWFVKNVYSEADLGNYIQVSKLGQIFLLLPTMIAAIIFPKTASGFRSGYTTFYTGRYPDFYLVYMLRLLLILAISGKWLFPFLYGPTFKKCICHFYYYRPGIFIFVNTSFARSIFCREK